MGNLKLFKNNGQYTKEGVRIHKEFDILIKEKLKDYNKYYNIVELKTLLFDTLNEQISFNWCMNMDKEE